jgi:hypothetical protein
MGIDSGRRVSSRARTPWRQIKLTARALRALNLSILSRALAAASFSLLSAGASDELEVSSGAASACSGCPTFGLSSAEVESGGV